MAQIIKSTLEYQESFRQKQKQKQKQQVLLNIRGEKTIYATDNIEEVLNFRFADITFIESEEKINTHENDGFFCTIKNKNSH